MKTSASEQTKKSMHIFTIILVLQAHGIYGTIHSGTANACSNMTDQQLSQRLDILNNFRSLNGYLPLNLVRNHTEIPERLRNEENESKRYGMHCPRTLPSDVSAPVYARSCCPWYYEVEHNHNRYPPVLLQAKSRCQFCVNEGSDEVSNNPAHTCETIRFRYMVLKKERCPNGLFRYTPEEKTLIVGATCSRVLTSLEIAGNARTERPPVLGK